jgi:tungstate transport system permease protein
VTDLARAITAALGLILSGDPELVRIVVLSLEVSLVATALAFVLAAPAGAALAACRFPARHQEPLRRSGGPFRSPTGLAACHTGP